jgi:hypothetical protein
MDRFKAKPIALLASNLKYSKPDAAAKEQDLLKARVLQYKARNTS